MCHHPLRFSEDCVDFNMHEEIEEPEKATGIEEKKLPEGLEEAAEKASKTWRRNEDGSESRELFPQAFVRGFIAGAEWDRQQMLNGAKDGYVSAIIIHNDGDEEHYAVTYPNGERPHSITDKVKIIIL